MGENDGKNRGSIQPTAFSGIPGIVPSSTAKDFVKSDIKVFFAARKLKKSRPWVLDIIKVLLDAPQSGMHFNMICIELWKRRTSANLALPKALGPTIQSAINRHTRQSMQWNGNPEADLFFSPGGKGSGTWAVCREKAIAWLESRDRPDL